MNYLIYGNTGLIEDLIELLKKPKKTFDSISDVYDWLVKEHDGAFDKRDLFISYYCYDSRIKKDVYIIGTAKHGSDDYMKKYRWPQYICYLVEG